MYLSLVTSGVSGLCLVLAKYWYNRRREKQDFNAVYRNGMALSVSDHSEHLQASAAAIYLLAAPSALSAAAAAETEALSEDGADAKADVFEAGEIRSASAETAFGEAAGTVDPGSQVPAPAAVTEPRRRTTREKLDDDHRVDEALASGDLSSMDTLLEDICDPVLRNRLMNPLVTTYYRLRSDSKHRAAFYRVADLQIEEAPSILDGIEEIGRPRPDYIEAFKSMAIALQEDGRQESAMAVCELALSLGLQDGTKTGFKGRITRLKKKSQVRIDVVCTEKLIH